MKRIFLFFLLTGCSAQMASHSAAQKQGALEELRIALLDVKQAFSEQRMDIQLLEEKLSKLKQTPDRYNTAQALTASLEKRISELEKIQEKTRLDLHELSKHANQTTNSLVQYRNKIEALENRLKKQNDRLEEVVKLKNTLNSISEAIGSNEYQGKMHKVRAGDSLEKIARTYNTSIEKVKKINGLTNNKIIIGQELKIPQ